MSAVAVPTMRFSEFVDFLLVRLFELERTQGAGGYFLLNDIAKELKEAIPVAWVVDAGRVLEARRLATCALQIGGHVRAQLTGEGRLFVEEERGAVKKVREELAHIIVTGSNNQIAVAGGNQINLTQTLGIEKEREPAFRLLAEIEAFLKGDKSLGDDSRADYLTDLEMVRAQLRKREPNRSALAAILEPLSQVTSIATKIADLVRLLNP